MLRGSPTLAAQFFDRPGSEEWDGSIPEGWTTTPYVNYGSYARFMSDLGAGTAPDVGVLMYDPENWWRTPPALRPVEPVASSFSRSSKTTSVIPRRERWYATEAPIQPPPTITTSAVERTKGSRRLGFSHP